MTSGLRRIHFLLPAVFFAVLTFGVTAEAPAAEAPWPVVAIVEGTRFTERDLNRTAGTANMFWEVGRVLGVGYDPDIPGHKETLMKYRRDEMVKGLLSRIRQITQAQAVEELNAGATDKEILAAQTEMYGDLIRDRSVRESGRVVLEALKSRSAGSMTDEAAYEKYLRGVLPQETWTRVLRLFGPRGKVKDLEALLNGKGEEVLKKPDETVREILVERRLRARILVRVSGEKQDVAAYLASFLETGKQNIPFESDVAESWLRERDRKVKVEVLDPAVAEGFKAELAVTPHQPK